MQQKVAECPAVFCLVAGLQEMLGSLAGGVSAHGLLNDDGRCVHVGVVEPLA